MQTLEKRVADALYEAFGGDIDRVNMSHAARAIIPLVLEHAAKVADEYAAWHRKSDDGLSGFDYMALGGEEIAADIRALGEGCK